MRIDIGNEILRIDTGNEIYKFIDWSNKGYLNEYYTYNVNVGDSVRSVLSKLQSIHGSPNVSISLFIARLIIRDNKERIKMKRVRKYTDLVYDFKGLTKSIHKLIPHMYTVL